MGFRVDPPLHTFTRPWKFWLREGRSRYWHYGLSLQFIAPLFCRRPAQSEFKGFWLGSGSLAKRLLQTPVCPDSPSLKTFYPSIRTMSLVASIVIRIPSLNPKTLNPKPLNP